ncbi:hypothetical protein ES705_14813 [subsurface metagenome]
MNKKQDSTELQFFPEFVIEQMWLEINRVSHLYKSDQISYQKANEKLHRASFDVWRASAMIIKERDKIEYLRKVKLSMDHKLQDKKYFSFSPCNIFSKIRMLANLVFHFPRYTPPEIENENSDIVASDDMKIKKISDSN